jgi:hypothetical protein
MYRPAYPICIISALASGALALPARVLPAPEAPPPPLITAGTRRALDRIRPEALRSHVRYLSDDLLEGRDTGSEGGLLAARYLAAQFKELGLKPAGDAGTYLQQVPLARSRMDPDRSRLVLSGGGQDTTLRFTEEFLLNGATRAVASVSASLVFAGYGITAPEFTHDDYEGLDVQGKLVVILAGEPPSKDPAFFDGDKDTKHGAGGSKILLARSKGAVGVITLLTAERGARFPWDATRSAQTRDGISLPGAERSAFPALLARQQGAAALFRGAPLSWEEVQESAAAGPVKRFFLPLTAKLELATQSARFEAPNVVGMVEGSDPELRKQAVVYTAHYDHIGKRSGEGDTIYNGAWDNASGTAEVLEAARAFAALRPAPKRSVLFVLVTGEEKGLLGSKHYTQQPPISMQNTAANINLDMTEIFGIPKELVPMGAERSTLRESCEVVAREMGLKIGSDPTPELKVFPRSDQFSFAQAGVPCLFLRWASEYEDIDAAAAKARAREKLETIYHKVYDEFDPTWSWEGMRRHTEVAVLIGLHVANQPAMPSWNPGDEYNRPRGAPRAAAAGQ